MYSNINLYRDFNLLDKEPVYREDIGKNICLGFAISKNEVTQAIEKNKGTLCVTSWSLRYYNNNSKFRKNYLLNEIFHKLGASSQDRRVLFGLCCNWIKLKSLCNKNIDCTLYLLLDKLNKTCQYSTSLDVAISLEDLSKFSDEELKYLFITYVAYKGKKDISEASLIDFIPLDDNASKEENISACLEYFGNNFSFYETYDTGNNNLFRRII